ncbi:hypothetical protein Q0F98_09585 [Paenibacillus amylolyticus]|nr:hypothetical protein Q0F98_09585 [Paenibacillus amylolyticus]
MKDSGKGKDKNTDKDKDKNKDKGKGNESIQLTLETEYTKEPFTKSLQVKKGKQSAVLTGLPINGEHYVLNIAIGGQNPVTHTGQLCRSSDYTIRQGKGHGKRWKIHTCPAGSGGLVQDLCI